MSLFVNPIISYAELSLPLPESRDLFLAETAIEWKAIYLSKQMQNIDRIPSMTEWRHDLAPLAANPQLIDFPLSEQIVLHGIWGLIWEYRQLNSVYKGGPSQLHSNGELVMSTRHQDLCQTLQDIRMSFSKWNGGPSPESMLMIEALLMSLHVSLEELQLFAGQRRRRGSPPRLPLPATMGTNPRSPPSSLARWPSPPRRETIPTEPPARLLRGCRIPRQSLLLGLERGNPRAAATRSAEPP